MILQYNENGAPEVSVLNSVKRTAQAENNKGEGFVKRLLLKNFARKNVRANKPLPTGFYIAGKFKALFTQRKSRALPAYRFRKRSLQSSLFGLLVAFVLISQIMFPGF